MNCCCCIVCCLQNCRDVYGVQKLANAVDRSQMILLRANFIAKCAHVSLQVGRQLSAHTSSSGMPCPKQHTLAAWTSAQTHTDSPTCRRACFPSPSLVTFVQHLAVCSPAQRQTYITKSVINAEALQALHTGVYLGDHHELPALACPLPTTRRSCMSRVSKSMSVDMDALGLAKQMLVLDHTPRSACFVCAPGSDPSKVIQLTDPKLRDWWTLPHQEEVVFYSTDPPKSATYSISLWNLGNR